MTERTPGNWTAYMRRGMNKTVRGTPNQTIWAGQPTPYSRGTRVVARVMGNEADARLIAAAPDLMAALEAAVAEEHNPDLKEWGEDKDWITQARRALYRARIGGPHINTGD